MRTRWLSTNFVVDVRVAVHPLGLISACQSRHLDCMEALTSQPPETWELKP